MTKPEQLDLLSIFHYIVGALHALFGSIGLIHFFIGCSFLRNPAAWGAPHQSPPPAGLGWFFALFGAVFVLSGWVLGIATALSGRFIAKRRHRKFSIVVGAINCAVVPFGTALGVFDIILLSGEDAKSIYAAGEKTPPL